MTSMSTPHDSPTAVGSTASKIRTLVEKRMLEPAESPSHIEFKQVPPNLVAQSLDDPQLFGANGARIFYDEEDHQRLILKLPTPAGDHAERQLTLEIQEATISMGLEKGLKALGGGRVTFGKIAKEPDSSFRPANLPPGRPKVANSHDRKWRFPKSLIYPTDGKPVDKSLRWDGQRGRACVD